jgi:esterase/lipase superfamily enzyme
MITASFRPDLPVSLEVSSSSGHAFSFTVAAVSAPRAPVLEIGEFSPRDNDVALVALGHFADGARVDISLAAIGPPGSLFEATLSLTQDRRAIATHKVGEVVEQEGSASVLVSIGLVAVPGAPHTVKRSKRTGHRTSDPERDDAEYRVWYATTRRPNDPLNVSKGFSATRDDTVHYGSCRVFIPKSHKIGSIGSPWWKRMLTLTDDRLRLLDLSASSPERHFQSIAARMARVAPDDQIAVVFVHGYNVSFAESALRAAQIGFDLSIRGAMAFFSWASQGTLEGYPADEATIEVNEQAIADYLTNFALKSGARAVHVIAHSMGNRGVLRAVDRIAATSERQSGVRFGQFILAAADVDADKFRELSAAYGRVGTRTTLYVSERDRAVEASRWLHQFPRVGLIPPVMVVDGIDTVNVTNADLTLLGHGYVASARAVLTDMHAVIRHNAPPPERFGLTAVETEGGERYWLVGD